MKRILLFGTLLLLAVGTAHAQFERVGVISPWAWGLYLPDAHAGAMGDTFAAIPDGAAAQTWNPAAFADGRGLQAAYFRQDLDLGGLLPPIDQIFSTAAVSYSLDRLRVGYHLGRYHLGPMEVRTAYDPEGFTADIYHYLHTLAASWLLVRPDDGKSEGLTLGVGVAGRRFSVDYESDRGDDGGEDDADGWDAEVGLLAAYDIRSGDVEYGFRCGAVARNVFGHDLENESGSSPLQQDLELGIAFVGAALSPATGRPVVAWKLAYNRTEALADEDLFLRDQDALGLELTFLETLSFRAGHDESPIDDETYWSYGFGLEFLRPDVLPVGITFEYARQDQGEIVGWHDHWAIGLSARPF